MLKLYLIINASFYPLYTIRAYPNHAPYPGLTPFYTNNANATACVQVTNMFLLNYKLFHEECRMDITVSNCFYLLLEENYITDLHELMLAFPEAMFLQLFNQAVVK